MTSTKIVLVIWASVALSGCLLFGSDNNDQSNNSTSSNNTTAPRCGDGTLGGEEECSCSSFGFDRGVVSCSNTCEVDLSDCSICGNEIIEAGETCEEGVAIPELSDAIACGSETPILKLSCDKCEVITECVAVVPHISASDSGVCLLGLDGSFECHGVAEPVDAVPRLSQIVVGSTVACGITYEANEVVCWHALGGEMLPIPPNKNLQNVSVGTGGVCVATAPKAYECFKFDGDSLGAASTNSPIFKMSSGRERVCVLRVDGNISCTGNLPGPITGSFLDLALYEDEVCHVDSRNASVCFNINSPQTLYARQTGVDKVSLSEIGVCWLMKTGSIECGLNRNLSDATPDDNSNFEQVAMGVDFACGLRRDGSLSCWGDNPLQN